MNKPDFYFKIPILAILLFCEPSLRAQVLIRANDKLISYDLIKPDKHYEKLTILDTAGKVKNEWISEYITKIDSVNKQILFVRYTPWDVGKFSLDSCINNNQGSVRYSLTNLPRTKAETIKYNATSVDSHLFRKGVYADKSTQMAEGYFDDTSIWNLFGYMTLTKNVKYYLNCYGSDQLVPLKYYVEYVMDDVISESNGTMTNCEVINVKYDNTSSFLWIDQKSHMLKKEVSKSRNSSFLISAI